MHKPAYHKDVATRETLIFSKTHSTGAPIFIVPGSFSVGDDYEGELHFYSLYVPKTYF